LDLNANRPFNNLYSVSEKENCKTNYQDRIQLLFVWLVVTAMNLVLKARRSVFQCRL